MRFLLVVAVSLLIIGCGDSGQSVSTGSEKNGQSESNNLGLDGNYSFSPQSAVVEWRIEEFSEEVAEMRTAIELGIEIPERARVGLEMMGITKDSSLVSLEEQSEIIRKRAIEETLDDVLAEIEIKDNVFEYKYISAGRTLKSGYGVHTRPCTIEAVGTPKGVVCKKEGYDDVVGSVEVNGSELTINLDGELQATYIKTE